MGDSLCSHPVEELQVHYARGPSLYGVEMCGVCGAEREFDGDHSGTWRQPCDEDTPVAEDVCPVSLATPDA